MADSKTVSSRLEQNQEALRGIFHADNNEDIIFRRFSSPTGEKYLLAYLDGMAGSQAINDFILRPFLRNSLKNREMSEIAEMSSCKTSQDMDDAVTAILSGDTAVFQEGSGHCLLCETKGFDKRSVSQPTSEVIVKGSQESFTEAVRTNITLVRRILKSPNLCTEFVPVGDLGKSLCAVVYLDDIVNKRMLEEVRRRLNKIKGDFILGSGMVEQLVEDNPFSLFPSILSTERPDRVAKYLSDGRVGIVVDGSPFVIIVPITIALLVDSPEGVSQRWIHGSFSRIIRMFALFCSTMLSGVYLAMILYHREMIPTQLLSAIVASRANIPFPSVLEVLMMELFFELVLEAGLRTPNAMGGAIGIVGALILGQSAVEANLVSPVTLIVVALSGLGNTVLPEYDLAYGLRIIKILFIFMGTVLGFLGIGLALVVILTMLCNQKSFGVSMLSIQALKWSDNGPVLFQWPLWKQTSRPRETHPQKPDQFPAQPREWEQNGGE